MTEIPDWVQVGAHVAEWRRGYAFTTVKRITDTMVVLANGSRYRRGKMRKVGEADDVYTSPTRLVSAIEAYDHLIKWAVRQAANKVSRAAFQVSERDADPVDALAEMAKVVADGQARLTELVAARAAIQNPEGTS